MIKMTVTSENGLHARPASQIVAACNNFESEIYIEHGDNKANAKSIMNLLGLGVKSDDEIIIVADGHDAKEAEQAIADIIGGQHA